MNLTRVLNNALPEMPARALSDRPPRKPLDMVFKEHIEDGQSMVRVVVTGVDSMFSFPSSTWALIQLFDGHHSYEEIADDYSGQIGREFSVEEVREFADALESSQFWYRSSQEKNVLLMQKSSEERRKLLESRKNGIGDLAEIRFPAVNPDRFVTWLYKHTSFVYTWWFCIFTIVLFSVSIAISISHWDEIGQDTLEFFNFTNKSWSDLIAFYLLAVFSMCWHELGHAHACKHYGGRVPAMGFLLIYLAPAFYTDTAEGFVLGSRYQRFIIAMAGAWAELYICAVATPIWWGTPPGSNVHNTAYLFMLMTGIAGVFLNWNPLMKLDGYYMLSEALGIADLKENSTAFVSAWVKRNIWRLPVEIPYVPKRRRLGFAVYALLSGAYSYTVLFIVARFVGNVFRNFNPDWSFIPEIATATVIFRSRIRTLVNFMKFLYLDKKDRIRAWFSSWRSVAVAAVTAILLLVPIWKESTDGRFVLEAGQTAIVRSRVPGTIVEVAVIEGESIAAGSQVVQLRNLQLQSRVAEGESEFQVASMRASEASLHYGSVGTAVAEREHLVKQNHELREESDSLQVKSPITGVVLTPHMGEQLGEYVRAGQEIVEIGDLRSMRARIYVSDHDMYKIALASPARLNIQGLTGLWSATTVAITPVSSELAPQLAEKAKYKSLNPLNFYVVDILIDNTQGILKPGMVGTAKIYGVRKNLLSHSARELMRFFGRKVW